MPREKQRKCPPPEKAGSDFLFTTYTHEARIRSTPTLQALVGVRVVAFLLGHSCKKTLCPHALTEVDHKGCPACISKGADDAQSNMPKLSVAATEE